MKNIQYLIFIAAMTFSVMACTDLKLGDAGLSKAPETSGATLDSLFSSITDADKVLLTAYWYLPYGIATSADSKLGGNCLESLTDLQFSNRNNISDGPQNLYYNGALSASLSSTEAGCEAYRFGSENDYRSIRYAWIFIENADRIPDGTPEEIAIKVAEAKMCIAISYFNMLRYVGGVPLLDHSIDPNEDMTFPRATFSETVEFIVRMIDEATPALPWQWDSVDDGRMTRAGALGLKLRLLCYAASPTFNSDTPYHPGATEYQCYMNYDENRWQRAKDAAEEFMEQYRIWGYYGLVQPAEDTHQARRLAYRSGYYDRGSIECLISTRKGYAASVHEAYFLNAAFRRSWGPTLNWANMYSWEDGTDFVTDPDDPSGFDWANPPKQPFFESDGTGIPPGIPTREPRLYENIAVPGDYWYDGTVAPTYSNFSNPSRNQSGFLPMKFALQFSTDRSGKGVHFPYLRFSEVLLNAAEAINEANGAPNATAYEYVNQVRARVGLPGLPDGLDKEAFRKALLRERCLEFGYEEVRWFDMVRWGLVDDFRKPLYGLDTVGYDDNMNPDATDPVRFTFKVKELTSRAWQANWDTKWYLAPIPRTELDKNYGMTQNPGW